MREHVRERHERAVAIVRDHVSLPVADLAVLLDVSMATVRRDAEILVSEGRLGRIHGALVWPGTGRPVPTPARAAPRAAEGTVVGMVVPTMHYSFSEIVQGARSVLAMRGARLVLSLSGYFADEDRTRIRRLTTSGVHGLLVAPSWEDGAPGPGEADAVLEASVPTVLVERWTRTGSPADALDRVRSDAAHGAGSAVHHLASLGHRRIAYALQNSPHAQQLKAGFETALATLGLPAAVAPGFGPGTPASESHRYDLTLEHLRAGVRDHGVTAALVHTDADAVVLLPRLQALGIRVPEDLALVVYDDEVSGLSEPALTAVAPPRHAVGAAAAGLLLDRIDGRAAANTGPPTVPAPRLHIDLLPQLRVRDSCGARSPRTDMTVRTNRSLHDS
ncbi:LacI family DNA-binding transcriptional regulator [Streptomyces sp. NBC_00503]|uniref:LacI family DNA-binding transcriptional regulator n=1 Tax=Streptomyces sp. NBC_00503 TaxID=2903659 RepID=UPI002E822D61|nr:substrate-binding domain-containing protein [Streptomyces sp. NBC_00503]WUD84912.1 substrate-binding domain-containing protein [Streptomyces sp. NBC_00503]